MWTNQINFLTFRVKQEARAVSRLSELGDDWREYDVIGIDEGQFYLDVSLTWVLWSFLEFS